MRHGQTQLNVEKRLQGSGDFPLNEVGRNQALSTKKLLEEKNLLPTKVISSPLERAIETGCLVSGLDKKDIEIADELIEMSFGTLEGKDAAKEDPTFLDRFFKNPQTYTPPEGGESYESALSRIDSFFTKLRKRIKEGEFNDDTLLLVSHGATSHGIFEYLTKSDRKDYWKVDFNNCAIVEIFLSENCNEDGYAFISEGFQKNW